MNKLIPAGASLFLLTAAVTAQIVLAPNYTGPLSLTPLNQGSSSNSGSIPAPPPAQNFTTNYNFYEYSTNLFMTENYVSNYFNTNVFNNNSYVSNFFTTNLVTTNIFAPVTITNVTIQDTYVSNFFNTNIFVTDNYVSNYFTTNNWWFTTNFFNTNVTIITNNFYTITNVENLYVSNAYITNLNVQKLTVNNIIAGDSTVTNGMYYVPHLWAGPTNTLPLYFARQYYSTFTPISITGYTGKSNTVTESVLFTVTNAAASNIIAYIAAGTMTGNYTNAYTVSNASTAKIWFEYDPIVGDTNAVFRQMK